MSEARVVAALGRRALTVQFRRAQLLMPTFVLPLMLLAVIASGTSAARNLPNSHHLIIHNATHDSYPCVENIVADFIDKGSVQGLDTACAEKIRRVRFITKTP